MVSLRDFRCHNQNVKRVCVIFSITVFVSVTLYGVLHLHQLSALHGLHHTNDHHIATDAEGSLRTSAGSSQNNMIENHAPEWKKLLKQDVHHDGTLNDSITIVTAYFNLGVILKGSAINKQPPDLYRHWMTVFGHLKNPVVAYFDENSTLRKFVEIRSKLPVQLTKARLINKTELWAFQQLPRIREIFNIRSYPKHSPNTIIPEYSAAMHAKYDLVDEAISRNYFHTRYFAWVDIGYFRGDINETRYFGLSLPPNFDSKKISFLQVDEFKPKLTPVEIVLDNKLWIGGGMFIGQVIELREFIKEYKKFTEFCLTIGFIDTDQQVIYGMYTDNVPEYLRPKSQIQTYESQGDWFKLGRLCRATWEAEEKEKLELAEKAESES